MAIVSALYAGLWILELLPHFPPRDALDRLLLIVLPAAAVAELLATEHHQTVVCATHDPELLRRADRIIELGKVGGA